MQKLNWFIVLWMGASRGLFDSTYWDFQEDLFCSIIFFCDNNSFVLTEEFNQTTFSIVVCVDNNDRQENVERKEKWLKKEKSETNKAFGRCFSFLSRLEYYKKVWQTLNWGIWNLPQDMSYISLLLQSYHIPPPLTITLPCCTQKGTLWMLLSLLSNFPLMALQTISCFHRSHWFDLWSSCSLSRGQKLRIYGSSYSEEVVK